MHYSESIIISIAKNQNKRWKILYYFEKSATLTTGYSRTNMSDFYETRRGFVLWLESLGAQCALITESAFRLDAA